MHQSLHEPEDEPVSSTGVPDAQLSPFPSQSCSPDWPGPGCPLEQEARPAGQALSMLGRSQTRAAVWRARPAQAALPQAAGDLREPRSSHTEP